MTRTTVPFVAGSLLAGCSLITSLDGLGSQQPGDGGNPADGTFDSKTTLDAPADVSSDATSDAGSGNLATNPSFDEGQGGCGPGWGNGYSMTFTRVSPGRTGPYACKVCNTGTSDSYALDELVPVPIDAGSYYAEAWLMTPEGGVEEQGGVGLIVNYDIDAGISGCAGIGSLCQGSFTPLPQAWTQTTASFIANGPGSAKLSLHAYGNTAGSCFVVDDVAFYAQ